MQSDIVKTAQILEVLGVTAGVTNVPQEVLEEAIFSDVWPMALYPQLIVHTDEQKAIRARSIINGMLGTKIQGHKFLDFGCGEGYCMAAAIAAQATFAVGYDPAITETVTTEHIVTTNDLQTIIQHGPYQNILLYDVFDHIMTPQEATAALAIVKQVLAPGGMIFLRCHPWTSRHGGHLYYKCNKAYAHMLLSEQRLQELGIVPSRKILRPIKIYTDTFRKAGFKITNQDVLEIELEPIFKSAFITQRFARHWAHQPIDDKLMRSIMAMQFVDFQLVSQS